MIVDIITRLSVRKTSGRGTSRLKRKLLRVQGDGVKAAATQREPREDDQDGDRRGFASTVLGLRFDFTLRASADCFFERRLSNVLSLSCIAESAGLSGLNMHASLLLSGTNLGHWYANARLQATWRPCTCDRSRLAWTTEWTIEPAGATWDAQNLVATNLVDCLAIAVSK